MPNTKDREFVAVDYSNPKTLPESFRLVQILLDNDKVIHGWYIKGRRWDGYRYRGEGVVAWKSKESFQ